MKRMLLLLMLLTIVPAGCIHYYTKPGKNNSDFNPDVTPQLAAG